MKKIETAIYQLPRRLSNRVNELMSYVETIYKIENYRSWIDDEDERLYLSITSPHQVDMDAAIPQFDELEKMKRVKSTWRVA